MKRKNFIHTLGATTLGALAIRPIFGNAHNLGESEENPSNHASGHATTTPPKSPYILPKTGTSNAPHNEAYWGVIAKNFKRPAGFINLENGYFSHQPQGTLSYHIDAETTINTQTSHFMRTAQTQAIEEARNAFAAQGPGAQPRVIIGCAAPGRNPAQSKAVASGVDAAACPCLATAAEEERLEAVPPPCPTCDQSTG